MNNNELAPENREAVYSEPVSSSAVQMNPADEQMTSSEVGNNRVEINRDASITEGDTFGDWGDDEDDGCDQASVLDDEDDIAAFEDDDAEGVYEDVYEDDGCDQASVGYNPSHSVWGHIVSDPTFFSSQVTEDYVNRILGGCDQTTDAKDHLTMMTLTKLDVDSIIGLLAGVLSDMPYHKVVAMLHQSGFTLTTTPTEVREEYSKGSFYD